MFERRGYRGYNPHTPDSKDESEVGRFRDAKQCRKASLGEFLNSIGQSVKSNKIIINLDPSKRRLLADYARLLNELELDVAEYQRLEEQAKREKWACDPLPDIDAIRDRYRNRMTLLLGEGAYHGAERALSLEFGLKERDKGDLLFGPDEGELGL